MGCGHSKQNFQQNVQPNEQKKGSYNFKVVILGNSSVGKTSILQRLLSNSEQIDTQPTIGMAYSSFLVDIQEKGIKINLQIWDTSGQEIYRELVSLFYRDADAAIVIFDYSDIKSLNGVEYWIN